MCLELFHSLLLPSRREFQVCIGTPKLIEKLPQDERSHLFATMDVFFAKNKLQALLKKLQKPKLRRVFFLRPGEGKQVFVAQTCRRRAVRTKTQLVDYKTNGLTVYAARYITAHQINSKASIESFAGILLVLLGPFLPVFRVFLFDFF